VLGFGLNLADPIEQNRRHSGKPQVSSWGAIADVIKALGHLVIIVKLQGGGKSFRP
jgi:hypothetical protein